MDLPAKFQIYPSQTSTPSPSNQIHNLSPSLPRHLNTLDYLCRKSPISTKNYLPISSFLMINSQSLPLT